MHRYLAFICSSNTLANVGGMQQLEASALGKFPLWSCAHRTNDMLVMHAQSRPRSAGAYPLEDRSGVVLGMLFRRRDLGQGTGGIANLDCTATKKILQSKCQHLVDEYWGKYVAFVRDPRNRAHHVLRDPTVQMRCYHTRWNGIDIFFSHIEDCIRIVPDPFDINWKHVVARLLAGDHIKRECGLQDVEDIPGGERWTVSGGAVSRTVLWNPADLSRTDPIEEPAVASRTLRSIVQSTVDALVSCFDRPLLSLSGGLDSSILAGCLAQTSARARITCLNYFLTLGFQDEEIFVPELSKENLAKFRRVAGHADERKFARLVCNRWGFPLVEHERRVDDVNMARVREAPLAVSPGSYIGVMDLDDFEGQEAVSRQADAFFWGQGGDTVFYSTFQSLAAIDYAHRHGMDREMMRQVVNACALSRESMWRVVRKAMVYGVLKWDMPAVYDVLKRPHLLTEASADLISHEDIEHPWMRLTNGLAPGKRYHVFGLAHSCQFYRHEYHRERHVTAISPFTAQPVVEVCLRVPTYTLLAGGVSRGLAREAFADLLPPEIQQRTVKGSGGPFYQRLVRSNMTFLRELLLDGLLVQQGILDRRKLDTYLTHEQQFSSVVAPQILDYGATEAWLRQWQAISQGTAAATSSSTLSPPKAAGRGNIGN